MLTTHEGAELVSIDELRRYGIVVPDGLAGSDCLCSLELPADLEGHTSRWVRSAWYDGYYEVGPDGRTWHDGYDNNVERDGVIILGRSDGRAPKTLEQIEAGRAA